MYKPEILNEFEQRKKIRKIYPYQGKYFDAMSVASKKEEEERAKTRSSWFNLPMSVIGKGLDYLSSFNPLEVGEKLGGMIQDTLRVGEKAISAPGRIYQLLKYQKEVKSLQEKKNKGQISPEEYRKRISFINKDVSRLQQGYSFKEGITDAASAVSTIASLYPVGKIGAMGARALLKGGVTKALSRSAIKEALTPTLPKATGKFGKAFQLATLSRPLSTPAAKVIGEASKQIAGGKVAADIATKLIPHGEERFKPVKILPEGLGRESLIIGGQLLTPLPFVGKVFRRLSKAKKFIGKASEYQAADEAFKRFFGKEAIEKVPVFKDKDTRASALAYFMGVMKERGIPITKENFISFLDDIYRPKVKDLPIISKTIKKALQANGIKYVKDVAEMDDEALMNIVKSKNDIKKIKEAIDEIGKTDFTGMHFTTPEEQLKALASFMYKGVHSGTWRGTAQELKAEVEKNYDEILKGIKGEAKIKGPMKGIKFKEFPIPIMKLKTSDEALKEIQDKTNRIIEAIRKIKEKKIEKIGIKSIIKVEDEIKEVKKMRRELQRSKRRTRKFRAMERKAADELLQELKEKHEELTRITESLKKQAREAMEEELKTKRKEVFASQFPKTKAIAKAPEVIPEFIIKAEKPKVGAWTKKTVKDLGYDTLYNQGVRELPKGDKSFLEGRKAWLGKIINKLKEGKIGRWLVPQNSRAIYEKIRDRLDKGLFEVLGDDAERAKKIIEEELKRPLTLLWTKVPVYRPTERELGVGVWKDIVSKLYNKPKADEEVIEIAKKLDKMARNAFVTSMREAGIPTHLIDKLRSYSEFYNTLYFYYTLGRFYVRPTFWIQQIPETYMWGTVRADKTPEGSLLRKALQRQISLDRTIKDFWKPRLTRGQEAVLSKALGYTEDAFITGWRQMPFMMKNEANAYGLGLVLKADKALENMPVVKEYLKKHGLKRVEDIPYLRDHFYKPLADDAEKIAEIIDKYGFAGAKAHLADETKTLLQKGKEAAIFDNAIREALKIARYTAFEEAVPLFLYNPNRSALEKTLHGGIMFPLSYIMKVSSRGGEYLLGGKAIRPKIAASIINRLDKWHQSEEGKKFESKYYNLVNLAESWLPMDPSYPFSTGYLPPFSKMVYRWIEKPEFYLDEKKGAERSLRVLIPSYREIKGWQSLLRNIKDLQDDIRGDLLKGKMTEKEAKEILEKFRYKAPEELPGYKVPKLKPVKFEKKTKIETKTSKEKAFEEKKKIREKLPSIPVSSRKKKEKSIYEAIIKAPEKQKIPSPFKRKRYSKGGLTLFFNEL